MTDRDDLRDRLDGLEAQYEPETPDTVDEQTREQFNKLMEDARERLDPEEFAKLNDPETPEHVFWDLLLSGEPET